LEFTDVAATFLHSYGNALMGCPCGCRSSSFSLTSLRTKGLRGCFVQSRMHHNPHFLHPANLGLLLGMPHFIRGLDLHSLVRLLLLCKRFGFMRISNSMCDFQPHNHWSGFASINMICCARSK
jgi:hypothetical protein